MKSPAEDAEIQEALSRKYVAPMVLPLDSGRYALFGVDRQIIDIGNWAEIQYWLDNYEPPVAAARPKRLTLTLTLEDLDL